jgi:hypothetical protein
MSDEQEVIIVDGKGTEHVFPAGFDPKRAAAIVRQATSVSSPAPEAKPAGDLGRFGGYKMIGDAVMSAGKAALDHPVQSLAMLGGALGVGATAPVSIPAGMAAAGLGAAGGAALGSIRNAMTGGTNGPTTASGVAKTMAAEGAAGAIGQGIGAGAAKIANIGGKLLYKTALRPSMGLQREFGDIAETGLREGARVSEGGLERATGARGASGAQARQMIADAEAGGAAPVTAKEVAGQFGDVMQQGQRQASLGRPDPRPPVVDRLKSFAAKHPNGITLTKAQGLKEEAQDLASRAYRAEDLGHPLTDLSAASDRAMATGLQKGIEARVPSVKDVNAHTRELIGLTRALEDATRRNVPGVGSIRTLLGDFVPSVSSELGIRASQLGRSAALPASFRTALIAALSGGDE